MRLMPVTAVLPSQAAPDAPAQLGASGYARIGFAATKNAQNAPQSRGTPG
jgi:hypothetical protein